MFFFEHEDLDVRDNPNALFGPFDESELDERGEDGYAELLAGCGNLDIVQLTEEEAAEFYINPRSYWMEQEAAITRDDRPTIGIFHIGLGKEKLV